ncbi:DnaB-like helicase C-terminal domain-containing protein [Amycolatopsis sp. NPDC051128]|uniref:replicative DNA helicase n=1 Tax=Amycolatopsis sp. NPDC051128 TaxID=3155412 RepID=UPI003437F633
MTADDEQYPVPNLAAEALAQLRPLAEEGYLVSLLTTITAREMREEALARVQPADFSVAAYGGLWEAAQRLYAEGKPVTARTVAAAADTAGELAERTLARFLGAVPAPADFPHALAEVTRCGALRRVVEATVRIQQRTMAAADGSAALAAAHEELGKLDTAELGQDEHTRTFRDVLTELDAALRSPESYRFVPTPWEELNERFSGGLHMGRMIIVGARPGEGKSIAAHQIAEHAASLGHPAAIFSVEMGRLEVAGRIVSNGATVEMGEITRRELSEHSWRNFNEYRARAQDFPLTINEKPDLTLGYIAAQCRALKRRGGLDVVVIDYLQLLNGDRRMPREQQVSAISRGLKQLSRELDCAVVVPAQLNRNAVARGKAGLSDLRESGSIEQDADAVILLARQFDDEGEFNGMLTIDIAKNRFGRMGELELPWRPYLSRIG